MNELTDIEEENIVQIDRSTPLADYTKNYKKTVSLIGNS